MKSRFTLAAFFFAAAPAFAADLLPVPEKPIAEKKELLFSDDFKSADACEGLASGGADVRRRERRAQGHADPRQECSRRRRQARHHGPRRRARAGNPDQGQRRRGEDSL